MFACAHPAIERSVRAPPMLQTILGFDAATIASALLVAPATMGQRLVRAKAKIKQAGIPFRLPDHDDLAERLAAVVEAIDAAFTEGWSDPAGTEARRRNLADEGVWLGQLIAVLLPDEAEALGLLALMLHAQARRGARRDAQGGYVPPAEQDPARWDTRLIGEAEALLRRASGIGVIGRYQLEAAVQTAQVIRRRTGRADWPAIVQLYDALAVLTGSPVVEINRAVAVAETRGAAAGLAVLDGVAAWPAMCGWPTINPTGPRARACWRVPARWRKPTPRMHWRSASRPIRRCGISCCDAARDSPKTPSDGRLASRSQWPKALWPQRCGGRQVAATTCCRWPVPPAPARLSPAASGPA